MIQHTHTLRLLCSCLFLLVAMHGQTQSEQEISVFKDASSTNFSLGMGIDLPVGDLADRFGSNLTFKLSVEQQTKSSWIYGAQLDYLFGSTVKEDVLRNYRLSNGNILGGNQTYANVFLRQRGLFVGGTVGRFISLSDKYRSGLKVTVSGGVFQHNVRIIDDLQSFSQLNNSYGKGYDRLTRGLAIREFVGWQYMSNDTRINFYMGVELMQGFTSAVRDYDFGTGSPSDMSRRFDGTIGFKVGWIFPLYGGYEDEEVFY